MTDRLFELMPALHRIADERQGGALRTLLAQITEQADALHEDGLRLLDDFFVETCRPWVLPYLGDLIGNVPLRDRTSAGSERTAESLLLDLVTGPDLRAPGGGTGIRADVARTIHLRRRKGTPLMLEELARDVTGWGARVVEFFTLLGWNQHLEHLRPDAAGCAGLRPGDVGDRIDGPWDTAPHTVDVRRIDRDEGRHNLPNVGFFLWRLGAYRITGGTPGRPAGTPAWQRTFSPLGRDMPLFCAGRDLPADERVASELDVEAPIRRAAFDAGTAALYRDPALTDGSLLVLTPHGPAPVECRNLENWPAVRPDETYGIDVALGRLVIPVKGHDDVTVSYHYGFSAPMGGGAYPRGKWLVPSAAALVTGGGDLGGALAGPVVTVGDNATYDLPASLAVTDLTIQAADGCRPHLRIAGGKLTVTGGSLTLGGLLVEGCVRAGGDGLATLRLPHTTLVPDPATPSVSGPVGEVVAAYAITGRIELPGRGSRLWLLDSIVDGGVNGSIAHIERTTVFGACDLEALPMASESIFTGKVVVVRRGDGCVRFSYLPPASETPRRYRCQPDLAADAARVRPVFTDTRYGRPAYAQLHRMCPEELTTGAEDGSEMGAFCFLRQPHRAANLRLRLDEYLPVGREAGLIYIT